MADVNLDIFIRQIQTYLNSKGEHLNVDGDMGDATYKAIVKHQAAAVIHGVKDWRVAQSLLTLRDQLNAAHPLRNKSSDGTIGDAAHASRTSDHNPWVRDHTGQPVVTAMDITHDPDHGVDCYFLSAKLTKDHRTKYVIWNKRIFTPTRAAEGWRPYTKDPHIEHLHISVDSTETEFDDAAKWNIA